MFTCYLVCIDRWNERSKDCCSGRVLITPFTELKRNNYTVTVGELECDKGFQEGYYTNGNSVVVRGGGTAPKRPRAPITHRGYKLFNWIANSACAWTSTTVIYATNHDNKQALTPVTSRAGARTPGLAVVLCLTHITSTRVRGPSSLVRVPEHESQMRFTRRLQYSQTNSPPFPHYPMIK